MMASHSRSRSKGSFSIFSIDNFHSLSRAGSRAVSRARHTDDLDALARSPSSLSRCDPTAQLPPSPVIGKDTEGAADCLGSPHTAAATTPKKKTFATASNANDVFSSKVPKRGRPFSWILLRAPAQALKKRSMSVQLPKDVSSSTIGRSVISAPILTSTTNAKVAEAEGVLCGELTHDSFSKSTWPSKLGWIKDDQITAEEARNLADKISKEEANTEKPRGRLQKLSDALRGKLGKTDTLRVEDASSLNHKIARRRAETLNLCKEKIKDLTGSGLVRRKSIDAKADKHADAEDPPLLSKTSEAALTLGEDNTSQYGSLSRSFNSALEKLDIAATTNMSFLRSRSSLFNLRKENVPHPVTSIPAPQTVVEGDGLSQDVQTNTAQQIAVTKDGQNKSMKQYQYSLSRGYIPAPPFHGYPGGVNGLRMHTGTTAFARSPNDVTVPDNSKAHSDQPLHMEDGCSIDEAPIFSPSMGDLSQYSNTPAAKTQAAPASTPTKGPTLKKSKSGLGLLGRAAMGQRNENQPLKKSRSMTFNPFKRETPPPMTNAKDSPYKPVTPSPLRNEAKLVKGRSARFGLSPRSLQDQAKRFGVIGMPSPSKPSGEW